MSRFIRRSNERGFFDHGWLRTHHTFSFSRYYDPQHMGYRSLRVINEDLVAPETGFGKHPHENMEILTIVLSGALRHEDSLGNARDLRPGEVQRMSAGSGIEHSEWNASPDTPVHLYQIWIQPRAAGLAPRYEQKEFEASGRDGWWQLVASPDGREGSFEIAQEADVTLAHLETGRSLDFEVGPGRAQWLQVMKGNVELGDGTTLNVGDAIAIDEAGTVTVRATQTADLLRFDLGEFHGTTSTRSRH